MGDSYIGYISVTGGAGVIVEESIYYGVNVAV